MTEARHAVQRDLERLEPCAQMNIMRFNKSKCKTLHLGHSNPPLSVQTGHVRMKYSPAENGLGVLRVCKQGMSQQCTLAAQKGKYVSWAASKEV